MKKTIFLFLVVQIWCTSVWAQDSYKYTVNLVDVVDDKVNVELQTPEITQNTVKFHFAKIVPGTYQIYDFGRFITNLQAFDRSGMALKVDRKDINTFVISNAKTLSKISYAVDDTYDLKEGKMVSGMSGTNIDANTNFVLNGHGFYGYFEGMKFMDYEIKILKPSGFLGSTALDPIESTDSYELYRMPSFNFVVDTPMMFCKPDNTVLKVADTDVLVSVYSPSGNVTSRFLADNLKRLLEAQKNYMGGKLPVDKYAFIMYFLKSGEHMVTGALEHNYSSLYALPDLPQEQILQPILNISAHEFFHIITPLNIHSREIQYFDFNDPDMSRHLWMYEGATEYFAHHAQLVDGMTTLEQFLSEMANKITSSKSEYNDSLPFTELSEGCLDEYRVEYANVYEKGALIGLCLDVYLRKYSKGNTGLIDLMNTLAQQYGDNRPFKDNRLFKEIAALSYPALTTFFKRYVSGGEPLPLYAVFKEMGVTLKNPEPYMGYSFGNASMGYNPQTKRVYVADIGNLNSFGQKMGYKIGDELLKINGEDMPQSGFHSFFQEKLASLEEGKILTVLVLRDDREVELSAIVEKVQLTKPAELSLDPNPTQEQLTFREQWSKGAHH
ncbi:MAG: hypothetical protein R2819_12585 [Allomuricauda sp.]